MYHPEIIKRNIERLLRRQIIKRPPIFHTIDQVLANVKHLNSIYNSETGEWTRTLVSDEIEFIRNERLACRLDYNYFKTRYCLIKDRTDRIVRYSPWASQSILCDIFAENELEGISIELQSLKARQLGVSREISLAQLHRIGFFGHINAVLASSTPIKTAKLSDMMWITVEHLPHWMFPRFAIGCQGPRDNAQRNGGEWFELVTGASVTLQSGSQVSGIARGTTPTVIHISELAEFERQGLGPEELIDSSLLRAVHPSARVLLILESTALGMNNWWHKKWLSSKAGWPSRRSRLRPVFLPWFVGSRELGYVYPERGFLDRSPVPVNYVPVPWAEEHARKAAAYVQANDLLRKYMGPKWEMPIEQIWFYEVERQQAINENRLNKFFQEMPASDDESFQSTNISIFATDTIVAHRDRTRTPLGVYGLVGNDMSPRTMLFSRSQIDPGKPIIEIHYEWGQSPQTYQLVPLKWNGYDLDDGLDKIYIFEMPEDGQIYGVGGDTADGIGRDRSCLEVLRKGSPWQAAGQVAEFASDKLNALDLTPYSKALSALYSVRLQDNFRSQCRTAIECKGKGDLTQLGMRLDGWTNFHRWIRPDNKKLDLSHFNKIGIYTTEWFRRSIQEYLMKMARDMEIQICSPFLVNEMQSLETDSFSQSFHAVHGGFDDRVMSLGFIIISLYQWEPQRPLAVLRPTQQSLLEAKADGKVTPKQYANYTPSQQERLGSLERAE